MKNLYRNAGDNMLKKIVILSLIFSAIGSMKVNVEMKNRYGLMQVNAQVTYSDYSTDKEVSRGEIISKVSKYKESGQYSKAIRFIEENVKNIEDEQEYKVMIEELSVLVKENLKNYTINAVKNNKELENYYNKITPQEINNLNIKSNTQCLLFISIENQKIYFYEKEENKWVLKQEFVCGTGEEGTETPIGIFKAGAKGEWFHSPKFNKGGKYYTQFDGEFLIHSVPYYPDKIRVWEKDLGRPMSHGCVRVSTEDAKTIYEKIPYGSTVIIY